MGLEAVRFGAIELDTDGKTLSYNMQPTKVKVHMKKALSGNSYNIFVKRL